jgi:hypothetical protein
VGVVVVKLTHAIARVVKRIEVWPGKRATFGMGVTAPFVTLLPVYWSWAPNSLCCGRCDHGVVAPRASHKASAAFTTAAAILWFPAPTASLIEGSRRIKNIAKKRSVSGLTPGGRCCLSFPIRALGLRPCISMGRQSK